MAINPHLALLNERGQSIWYDNLARTVLRSGELKGIIDAGVSGLTSNPTIFKKAIADTADYDADIRALAQKGSSVDDIIEDLMIADIAEAADLLRPVYDRTGGGDGYASIEVSPTLAADTEGSLIAARRIWGKLKRPNIMIKIPGTAQGIPAVGALLEEGINVNITLLFSDAAYRAVAETYIAALERRAAKNLDVRSIASVASFFVSRVDAIVEKSFDSLAREGRVSAAEKPTIEAKVGIANSRVAYASFRELFGSERWKKLERLGARVQRPLWASTGTKNPAYSPVLYVEQLACRDTVNTVPPQTLKAVMERASLSPALHEERGESAALIGRVNALGIPFDRLLEELCSDGVKLFAESYRELSEAVTAKRDTLV